jgi:hypothetical protein
MPLDERLRDSLRRASSRVEPNLNENLQRVRLKTRRLVLRQRVGVATLAVAAAIALLFVGPRVVDFVLNFHPIRPARPEPSAKVTDPLNGDWRQESTCSEIVRTMRRVGASDGDLLGFIQGAEGRAKRPPRNKPCKGAPAKFVRFIRFRNGHLLIFDPPQQALGADALYKVINDHTFTIVSAPGDHNFTGVTRFRYNIVGDQLTINVLTTDSYVHAAFESAPYVRSRG